MIKLFPNKEISVGNEKAVVLYMSLSSETNEHGRVKYDVIVLFSAKIHVILGINSLSNLEEKLLLSVKSSDKVGFELLTDNTAHMMV